jgi:hypothetical protein
VNETERAERERSAQMICIFLGPIILASLAAGGSYRVVCRGRTFTLDGVFGSDDLFSAGFWIVASSLLAWMIRERRARLAFAILALQQVMLVLARLFDAPVSPWLLGSLSVAVAVLATASGASAQPKWRVVIPLVFAVMFLLRWITLYYADGFFGRHSVFRPGPFC